MDHLSRQELKSLEGDHFAAKVGSAMDYAVIHKQQVVRWALIGVGLLLLLGAAYWYYLQQRAIRQQDLKAALSIVEAPVGTEASKFFKSYPTLQAKDDAAIKAFTDVVAKHAGSKEGALAQYYLGTIYADRGKVAEAEGSLKAAVGSNSEVSPLAKIALSQIYAGQGKTGEVETLLRSVIANPSTLVSKEQATILLAQAIGKTKPAEAKKLLEPLRGDQRQVISRAANSVYAEIGK